ncbi:MAG TPA: formylglycine-generating enzyme family protein [Thermoanaerobaculia bacterium]|nr:formylglycine-generating enzyme family protein [Thermoanaerobaculia bacterium]
MSNRLSNHARRAGAVLFAALAASCATDTSSAKKARPAATVPAPTPKPQPAPAPAISPQLLAKIEADFVRIPAGTLPSRYESRGKRPETKVAAFAIGRHEVTQELWTAVTGENPSRHRGDPQLPVTNVSWNDAQKFIERLNEAKGSRVFRLPTAREWELACRAGAQGHVAAQSSESSLDLYSWWGRNSGSRSHPVGTRKPNAFGLFDMLGNVAEWCETAEDPKAKDILRVHAGGHFLDQNLVGQDCSTTAWLAQDAREEWTGFRLARTAKD